MSTRAWVVATALTLGIAVGADAQVADRLGRSRASSSATQRGTQSGSSRAQAQGRAGSQSQGRSTASQGRATTQSQGRATRQSQGRATTQSQGRATTQSRGQSGIAGRVGGAAQPRTRADQPPVSNRPPVTNRSSGIATARDPERTAQPRQSGQVSGREDGRAAGIGDQGRNGATRVVPGGRDNPADRNRAIRVVPGRGVGVTSSGEGPIRGYATGVPDPRYARGWDWDRRRDRDWYYNRNREWYRYWERDRFWNWRAGPIPGWWLDFRWTPRGVGFAWHINVFWNSWDDHYRIRRDHDWLHHKLDRIHEEWHLRHGWRGYGPGWYHAHEALHDRLEREHDRWYRRYDSYAWPWDGPEIWLEWGIADPWEYDNGYYDDGYYRDHGWGR